MNARGLRILSILVVTASASLHVETVTAQRLSDVACAESYNVVGSIHDGKEAESINGRVFTDEEPFRCEIYKDDRLVDFVFNASSTDPVTDCTYDIARLDKETSARLDSTETLSMEHRYLHYRVLAVPRSNDSDCEGLTTIDVDPYVEIVRRNDPPTDITTGG